MKEVEHGGNWEVYEGIEEEGREGWEARKDGERSAGPGEEERWGRVWLVLSLNFHQKSIKIFSQICLGSRMSKDKKLLFLHLFFVSFL